MVDPGFPIGGHAPIRGGMDLRCRHFSVKMYAKTKELGPIGGRAPGTPLDPPMCPTYQDLVFGGEGGTFGLVQWLYYTYQF